MNKKTKRILRQKQSYVISFIRGFVKWVIVAGLIGIISGLVGSAFRWSVGFSNDVWHQNTWLIFLLPIGGLAIVGIYRLCGVENPMGTNKIIKSVRNEDEVPIKMGPLIFVSTVITHFLGGSAGREGAALQLGGTIGTHVGRLFSLDEKDLSIAILGGMSGVFASLFGTPVTSVFFALEVISVGVIYYSGLVPCLVSSLTAYGISTLFSMGQEIDILINVPSYNIVTILKVALVGICCAVVSIFYIQGMDHVRHFFDRIFKNAYVKILVGSGLIIILSLIFRSGDYNGSGMNVIFRALEGDANWYDFLLKILFTAITLGVGFKGGEIVPTFFIGSTLGCFVGSLIGLDPGFAAAVGLAAIFCAVVNCPVASIILGVELFGSGGFVFFAIACCLSYMLSGYYGLYGSQKILYSKIKAEFINIKAK